ncbi:hypothetical protein [Streptomyces sp. PT12]|nr:hypothetical protein [Streptomyces sp. PT12]
MIGAALRRYPGVLAAGLAGADEEGLEVDETPGALEGEPGSV